MLPEESPLPPEQELYIMKLILAERDLAAESFAIKLVERVVWGTLSIILTSFLVALAALVWK